MQSIIQLTLLILINDIDNVLIFAALLRKHCYDDYPKAMFLVKSMAIVLLTVTRSFSVAAVQFLTSLPGFHLITGVVVLWIGIRMALAAGGIEGRHPFSTGKGHPPTPLYQMIFIILLTDFAISIDTVILAAGLAENLFQAVVSLSLSLFIIFSLLSALSRIVHTVFWLQIIAGGILAQVSVLTMAKEPSILHGLDRLQHYFRDVNTENITHMLAIDAAIIVVLLGVIRLIKTKQF
ncbi:hypothetical protein DCC39_13810 [Pueribacillus theae]|uniref:Tellurium resistance protein TerC n=1 Tax=Pueribacillus theae TaxID=2171751 RepID=A0A2U1JW40_9BACI|nr:hypothetical protein [Pueribacillus theae]PWA09038.1 hypothetical protein DCC39_13810 [Pueribacillus theae]